MTLERARHGRQPVTQPLPRPQTFLDEAQVVEDDGPRIVVGREQLACPVERQPEAAQRDDPVQPRHVLGAVEPMPRLGAADGTEQPDPVVVVQRPHGQPGGPGEVADAQWRRFRHDADDART